MGSATSGIVAIEAALLDRIAAVTVSYRILDREPVTDADLREGGGDAQHRIRSIWLAADVDADLDTPQAGSAGLVTYNETIDLSVVVQTLAPVLDVQGGDTPTSIRSEHQDTVDAIMHEIARNPDLGAGSSHQRLEAFLTGWSRTSGKLPNSNGVGVRTVLDVTVESRLTPTAP